MRNGAWLRDSRQRSAARASSHSIATLLMLINFLRPLESVRVFCRFVWTQAHDSGEPQRIAALVPIGPHHVIERDLKHDLRLHHEPHTFVVDGMVKKPLGHLCDLSIR